MLKVNDILKIRFNNDEKPTRLKNSRQLIWSKQNEALEFAVSTGYLHCIQTQRS